MRSPRPGMPRAPLVSALFPSRSVGARRARPSCEAARHRRPARHDNNATHRVQRDRKEGKRKARPTTLQKEKKGFFGVIGCEWTAAPFQRPLDRREWMNGSCTTTQRGNQLEFSSGFQAQSGSLKIRPAGLSTNAQQRGARKTEPKPVDVDVAW